MIFGRKGQEPEVGYDVVTTDEEHLGAVVAVQTDAIDVQGGTLDHPSRWRIPRSAIGRIDGTTIHLTLSRGQVIMRDWQLPADTGSSAAPGSL